MIDADSFRNYLLLAMSTIDFTCQKCEGDFEIDFTDLADGSEALECPHCANKLSKTAQEDFSNALSELATQMAALSKKFTFFVELDSEEVVDGGVEAEEDDEEEAAEVEEDDEDDDDDDEDDDDEEADDDDDDA
jgi:hypothetical protein